MSHQGDRIAAVKLPDPVRQELRGIVDRLNRVVDDLERMAAEEEAMRQQAASNGRHKERPDRGP